MIYIRFSCPPPALTTGRRCGLCLPWAKWPQLAVLLVLFRQLGTHKMAMKAETFL